MILKYFLLLFFLTLELFAYTSKEKNHENLAKTYCLNLSIGDTCVERKIIEVVKNAHKQIRQNIYINDAIFAAGYPQFKQRTHKIKKWSSSKNTEVTTDNIYFIIDKNIYNFTFKTNRFSKYLMPIDNFISLEAINDKYIAIQYLTNHHTLGLAILNTESQHLDIIKTSKDLHTLLYKKNIIDLIKTSNDSFINQYLKSSKYKNLSIDTEKLKIEKIYDTTQIQNVNISYREYTNILTKSSKKNHIQSILVNKYFEPLSFKIKPISNVNLYLNSLSEQYNDLPRFVHNIYSLFIIILTLLSIVICYLWLKKLIGGFKLPTIASFFMLFYILIPVLGATLLNTFYFKFEYNMGFYERKDLMLNIWIYSMLGLLLIPVGMQIANWIFKYHPKQSFTHFLQKSIICVNEKKLFYTVLALMLISLTVLILYITKIGDIPLLGVIQHLSPEELAQLRSSAGASFDGKVYRYMIFIKILPLLFLLIAFILKSKSKQWFSLFIFILIYTLFVNLMDLQKAPILNILLLLLITHFYIRGAINWKYLIGFIFITIGLLISMYIFFMGHSSHSLFTKLGLPFHRIFIGTISPVFWWQLYVEQHAYLHGLSFPNPKHIFDFEHIQITKEIMRFVHPELKEIGVVGSMPTVFWADWFINFGKYALAFSMLLFGFIIQSLDIFFINKMQGRKSVLLLVLFIYLLFYMKHYIATTYLGIFIDTNIVIPIIFMLGLHYLSKKYTKTNIGDKL